MPDAPPQTRKKRVMYPTPSEFALTVVQGMVIRDGAAAFSDHKISALRAGIAKGYDAMKEAIDGLHEERG